MEFPILSLVPCGLAFLSGVLLNGYILFITSCRLEMTVNTIWFMSRAVADLIFIVFLPLRVISTFTQNLHWAQRLSSTVTSFHMFSSVFILTALSINRCILVAHPAWAWNHCTLRLAFWVVLGIWALSFGLGLRYSNLWESLHSPDRVSVHFWLEERRLKDAVAIQFLVGFLIPLALILIPILYIIVAAKLKTNRLIQSIKSFKILLGLIPTFFISWLPYHIFSFLQISLIYPEHTWIIESIFASLLTYFNSCLNPIFYTMEDDFLKYWQNSRNPQAGENSGLESAV